MKTGRFGEPCIEHHTAVIYDRGGARRVSQVLDLASVTWRRKLDGRTTANLKVTGRACIAQSSTLTAIAARRHELVIFRGRERVWEGPVLQTLSTSSSFELTAGDITSYLAGRALSKAWPNLANGGSTNIKTQRLAAILAYELATGYSMVTTDGTIAVPAWESLSPAANVLPYLDIRHNPVPANATLTVTDTGAFEKTLMAHLQDLVDNGGAHYTTMGRRLVIWDSGVTLNRLRVVSERDFTGEFNVIKAGSDFATIDHVTATEVTDSTVPPVVGHGSVDFSYYGPWERVDPTSSEAATSSTPDIGALNSQAKARVNALYPLPTILETASGASLKLGPGITLDKLVPGVIVPVVSAGNLRKVEQDQRLDSVTVTEDSTGEKIQTTLGATDVGVSD